LQAKIAESEETLKIGKSREIVIDGPVDVEVYNRSGELVTTIIDGVPQENVYYRYAIHGEKVVSLDARSEYTIKLIATGDGLMTCAVHEKRSTDVKRILVYYDVPITKGQIVEFLAPTYSDQDLNSYDSSKTEYKLSTNGTIIEKNLELSGEALETAWLSVSKQTFYVNSLKGYDDFKFTPEVQHVWIGSNAQLEAIMYPNWKFTGWYDEDEIFVTSDLIYRFRPERDRVISARYEPIASAANELSSLSVEGVTLVDQFLPEVLNYSAKVPYDTSSVFVEATAANPNAIVVGTGAKALDVGKNTIRVIVVAQGVEQLMYDINIERARPDKDVPATTPMPTFKGVEADTDYWVAAVNVLAGEASDLEAKFVVAPIIYFGKYLSPLKIAVDMPPLYNSEMPGLTGVAYDENGAVAKRLGGEFSEDKKTFVFFDNIEKLEKPATYGLIRANDLMRITLAIGSKKYVAENAPNATGTLDVEPYIDSRTQRAMVPLRFIAESLGATVDWAPYGQNEIKVSISAGSKVLTVTTGQDVGDGLGSAVFDGENLRTFVPVRYIMEQFDAHVVWDSYRWEIRIYR
jgi:hypothetical protein